MRFQLKCLITYAARLWLTLTALLCTARLLFHKSDPHPTWLHRRISFLATRKRLRSGSLAHSPSTWRTCLAYLSTSLCITYSPPYRVTLTLLTLAHLPSPIRTEKTAQRAILKSQPSVIPLHSHDEDAEASLFVNPAGAPPIPPPLLPPSSTHSSLQPQRRLGSL